MGVKYRILALLYQMLLVLLDHVDHCQLLVHEWLHASLVIVVWSQGRCGGVALWIELRATETQLRTIVCKIDSTATLA